MEYSVGPDNKTIHEIENNSSICLLQVRCDLPSSPYSDFNLNFDKVKSTLGETIIEVVQNHSNLLDPDWKPIFREEPILYSGKINSLRFPLFVPAKHANEVKEILEQHLQTISLEDGTTMQVEMHPQRPRTISLAAHPYPMEAISQIRNNFPEVKVIEFLRYTCGYSVRRDGPQCSTETTRRYYSKDLRRSRFEESTRP